MNLHNEIINIPTKLKREAFHSDNAFHAYKVGQKESRHAAAELSLKAESRIDELDEYLESLLEKTE